MSKSVYLAGPLFTLAEQEFNAKLRDELKRLDPELEIILPQERAPALLAQENGQQLVFADCVECVKRADLVLAILDGADADSGTCFELGIAHAHGIPILGVRTDFRISEAKGLNLMLTFGVTELILETQLSLPELAAQIQPRLQALLARSQNSK